MKTCSACKGHKEIMHTFIRKSEFCGGEIESIVLKTIPCPTCDGTGEQQS